MKRLAFLLIPLLLFALFAPPALASEDEGEEETDIRELIAEQIETLSGTVDLSPWESYFDGLMSASPELSDQTSVSGFVAALAMDGAGQGPETLPLLSAVKSLFIKGFSDALSSLGAVLAAALMSALCSILFGAESKKPVLLILCAAAMLSSSALFAELTGEASAVITRSAEFCEVTAPILSSLLIAMGYTSSAGVLAPKIAFIADGVAAALRGIVMPMLASSGVLAVLNALSESFRPERAVKLLHRAAKWLLGLAAAVYTASTVVGGIGAGAADGVSLRTARYAVDKLVPAAGGMITGAAEAVRSGALLFKNAAGAASILLLAAAIAGPLVKIACGMLALRTAAAVAEPFSDPRIVNMLDSMADTASLLFACAAAAASMFTVAAVTIIAAGGSLAGV